MNEFELTETKWDLLKQLEQGPLSPKELADLTQTSIANTSQQLKLLEAQGYLKRVKKKGVLSRQNRDVRILYALSKPRAWISKISNEGVVKKEIKEANNFLINLLLCDIKDIKPIIKFFLEREDLFKKIEGTYYLQTINNEVHFLVITNELDFFRNGNHTFEINYQGKKTLIKFWSHSFEEFKSGFSKNEPYFVDMVNRICLVYCEKENIKNIGQGINHE